MGTQVETPLRMATGWPLDWTQSEPMIHIPVTQGPFPAGGTKAHPATVQGAAMVAIGMPETRMVGTGVVGTAMPP